MWLPGKFADKPSCRRHTKSKFDDVGFYSIYLCIAVERNFCLEIQKNCVKGTIDVILYDVTNLFTSKLAVGELECQIVVQLHCHANRNSIG